MLIGNTVQIIPIIFVKPYPIQPQYEIKVRTNFFRLFCNVLKNIINMVIK